MSESRKISIDGVEYNFEDLTDQQKICVSHLTDLEAKLAQARFQMDQLNVAKDAFVGLLKQAMEAKPEA